MQKNNINFSKNQCCSEKSLSVFRKIDIFSNFFNMLFIFLILPKSTNLKIDQSRQFYSTNFYIAIE